MTREAIGLVLAMLIATLTTAACDKTEPRSTAPGVSQTGPAATPVVAPNTPQVALGTPTAAERKDGANPVQGQVDPKEPAQRRDFEPKR